MKAIWAAFLAAGLGVSMTGRASGQASFTALYTFAEGGLTQVVGANGALYGTTGDGGDYNCGTVFELRPPAPDGPSSGRSWTETVLCSFGGQAEDGAGPWGIAIGADGTLYCPTEYCPTEVGGAEPDPSADRSVPSRDDRKQRALSSSRNSTDSADSLRSGRVLARVLLTEVANAGLCRPIATLQHCAPHPSDLCRRSWTAPKNAALSGG